MAVVDHWMSACISLACAADDTAQSLEWLVEGVEESADGVPAHHIMHIYRHLTPCLTKSALISTTFVTKNGCIIII